MCPVNGYIWLLSTPEGERAYTFDHSRAGHISNGVLGEDFAGVLVTDCYGGYNDTPGGQHQRCWVHLLRAMCMPSTRRIAHSASPA